MKGHSSAYVYVVIILAGFFQLTGCGLKYTAPPTDADLENHRREALEQQLFTSYRSIDKKYIPLTYGDLTVVKPDTYRKLDSLFAVKYELRGNPAATAKIDPAIEIQRVIALNDTNQILYVETHWFELQQDSASEFLIANISLNKYNTIKEVKNLELFDSPKDLVVFARDYMLEKPFVDPDSGYLSNQEEQFYSSYKTQSATLTGEDKDAFFEHTLRLMQLAQRFKTLSTETLLSQIALQTIHLKSPATDLSLITLQVNEIDDTTAKGRVFNHYEVTATNKNSPDQVWVFSYDAYLDDTDF